jgi:hypothetical protein
MIRSTVVRFFLLRDFNLLEIGSIGLYSMDILYIYIKRILLNYHSFVSPDFLELKSGKREA